MSSPQHSSPGTASATSAVPSAHSRADYKSLPHVGQLPDFAHVPVVHDSHMTIVPGDRDRIPTRFSDNAAVSAIALPANAITVLEALRFGGGHVAPPFGWVAYIVAQT